MRASRLLSMLIQLQLRGVVTAQAFATEFEVSMRTIYRDVDELSAAGVPIYAVRGPGGGFRLMDGYSTRLTGLDTNEAGALLLAGMPGPAAHLGLAEPTSSVRHKLLAALPVSAREDATRVSNRFHLDPIDWYRRARLPSHLPAVAEALWGSKRLTIRYESWSATFRRTIEPLGLVLKAGVWYLVARGEDVLRTYKVSRVKDLAVLDDRFTYPADFDLARHWQADLQRFEDSLQQGVATLRVSPAALSQIDELGADAADAVLAAKPDPDGWREAVILIEGVAVTARLLLGFADDIEVLSPPELRDALACRARRIASLYS